MPYYARIAFAGIYVVLLLQIKTLSIECNLDAKPSSFVTTQYQ